MAGPALGAGALLSLAKAAAKQAGVPVAQLTKRMIQNMNIPVRLKKLLQGPMTAGEKKIAPSIKSSVTMAKGEAKVGAGGLAIGLTPTIVSGILSAAKNTEKTSTGKKGRNKPRTPVNRALDSAKKAMSNPPKKPKVKKKAQPNVRSGIKTGTPQRSGAVKKSLRPRKRPGS